MNDPFRWVLLALLIVLYVFVVVGVLFDYYKPVVTRRRQEQLDTQHDMFHANEFPAHHYRVIDPDRHPVDWAEEGWFASGQPR
jgi:hypothetical protein